MDDRTVLIWSERFKLHDTGRHPENAERLTAIWERLQESRLLENRRIWEPRPASVDDVCLVHYSEYAQLIERVAASGGRYLDPDTWVGPNSYDVALLAAGAAKGALDAVLAGRAQRIFVFSRPPGHHAERNRAMGFCLFNNIAIAAQHALDQGGVQRLAIVDWDVHHGNGTQSAFYGEDRALFISIHQAGIYPGTGRADQTGGGPGLGSNINIPLPSGTGDTGYLRIFEHQIVPKLRSYRPDIILVSAGFDAHRNDPLASMDVTEWGFAQMAKRLGEVASEVCGGRLVLILEGGYDRQGLAGSVEATLRALDGEDVPEEVTE